MDDDIEILLEFLKYGDKNTKKIILDALSYIKDEKSISFYMTAINNINDYLKYRDIVLRLDAAVYCPKVN